MKHCSHEAWEVCLLDAGRLLSADGVRAGKPRVVPAPQQNFHHSEFQAQGLKYMVLEVGFGGVFEVFPKALKTHMR